MLFLWKERTDIGGYITSFNNFLSSITSKLFVRCTGFSKLDFGYLSSLFFISYLIILTFLTFSSKVFFKSLSSFPLFSARYFSFFFFPAVPMWDLSSPNQGFNLCPLLPLKYGVLATRTSGNSPKCFFLLLIIQLLYTHTHRERERKRERQWLNYFWVDSANKEPQ